MQFIRDLPKLRKQRLLARDALKCAGKLDFKPESSAKWSAITKNRDGSILIQIEHDDAKDISPKMLLWWFEYLGCTTTWNGEDFSGPEVTLYHLWHHRDHVAVTPLSDAPGGKKNLGFLEGADSQIHECFNEFHSIVHQHMRTTKLDEREFTFSIMAGPFPAGHIKHTYEPVEGGCSFYAETKVGMDVPVIGLIFNWLILPFIYTKKSAEHWIRHNIEETGRTQDVLPILYANQDKVHYSPERISF
jgi:hypothetical protein